MADEPIKPNDPDETGVTAEKRSRVYTFIVNAVSFKIIVPVWDDQEFTPKEILAHDLHYCADLLDKLHENSMVMPSGHEIPVKHKHFKLPPMKPCTHEDHLPIDCPQNKK